LKKALETTATALEATATALGVVTGEWKEAVCVLGKEKLAAGLNEDKKALQAEKVALRAKEMILLGQQGDLQQRLNAQPAPGLIIIS
jgi:hypothetical protein